MQFSYAKQFALRLSDEGIDGEKWRRREGAARGTAQWK
jgi:hypothetical protein